MTPRIDAIITELPGGSIEIESPFNARFVSAIKQVPERERTFSKDVECTVTEHHGCRGRWVISAASRSLATTILRSFYLTVQENTLSGTIMHRRDR